MDHVGCFVHVERLCMTRGKDTKDLGMVLLHRQFEFGMSFVRDSAFSNPSTSCA